MGKPRKPKKPIKVKIKTKTYIGNPGKKAQMQIDSLKAKSDTTQKADTIKIKINVK